MSKTNWRVFKRSMIGLVTLILLLLPGIGVETTCACVSPLWLVAGSVNRLDALVQQYASEHTGLYPRYDDLMKLAEARDQQQLTPDIDIVTRTFLFVPMQADAHTVGYAVSADQQDYVLLGIGGRKMEVRIYKIVIPVLSTEMRILYPGDNPPMHPSYAE